MHRRERILGTLAVLAWAIAAPAAHASQISANPNAICKVTPSGSVSIFASGFSVPGALAFTASGDLFVANLVGTTVSKVTPSGSVSTFASGFFRSPDGFGPTGLAFNASGDLFVGDWDDGMISRV